MKTIDMAQGQKQSRILAWTFTKDGSEKLGLQRNERDHQIEEPAEDERRHRAQDRGVGIARLEPDVERDRRWITATTSIAIISAMRGFEMRRGFAVSVMARIMDQAG